MSSINKYNLPKLLEEIKDNQDLLSYDRFNALRGLSDARRSKIICRLKILEKLSPKPLKELTKEEVFNLIEVIKQRKVKPITIEDYKIILRGLFKYYEREDILKLLKVNNRVAKNNNKLPEEILTEDEIKQLVSSEKSIMYQALIMSLWESGARRSEFLTLKIKDVYFDADGCFFILPNGKTGMRRVRLVNSTSLLSNWLEYHPLKANKGAPLWISYLKKQIGYTGVVKHFREAFRRAGINKPFNLHHFRHSRATFLAKYLKESELREFFGWSRSSDMPSVYVHLSGRDVDDAILGVYNKSSKQVMTAVLEPIKCFNCKGMNESGRERCRYCGLPLDFNALRETLVKEEKLKRVIEWADNYMPKDLQP